MIKFLIAIAVFCYGAGALTMYLWVTPAPAAVQPHAELICWHLQQTDRPCYVGGTL